MGWHIAPMTEEHIASYHAVLDSVAREKRFLLFLQAPPLEQSAGYVRENIRKGHVQLVAVIEDAVVGWCDIVPIPRESTRHVGTLGIGVLKTYRGRGIGPALLRAAIERGRAGGLTRIALDVREDNKAAIALYERVGFEREGLKRNGVRVDGVYYDLVSMALLFPG